MPDPVNALRYDQRTPPTVRRTWSDFERASGFNTLTRFNHSYAPELRYYAAIECFAGVPYGVSAHGATEAEAREKATAKANERWPAEV